jgi:LacI family transcriptional regulator
MAVAISEDKRFEPCGRAGVDEILSDGNPPRVIFCSYDRIAYGAIRELLDKGYRVPEDVAVFSVDDAPSSEYFKPSLTSVNHAVDETCEAVSAAIIKKIKGEPFAEEIRIVCPLSRRESTNI